MGASSPLLDLGFAIIWLLISNFHWIGYKNTHQKEEADERALGASVIIGQLSANITGASVILAGIGAFVALKGDKLASPENYHLLYSAFWSVFSLGVALFTMSLLPANAPATNFVRLRKIAVLCSMGLFFCLAAGFRFMMAVWAILFV